MLSSADIKLRVSDPNILQFATAQQEIYLQAIAENLTLNSAATAIQVGGTNLRNSMLRLLNKAAKQGYAPTHDMTHTAPEGMGVSKVSTLRDDEGNVKLQWTQVKPDAEATRAQLKAFVDELIQSVPPAEPVAVREQSDKSGNDDIMAVYPIGDAHLGMYAWGEETGDDFDMDIAEKDLRAAVDALTASTPAANTAIVLPLGDFLHGDNSSNQTARSGHGLDIDTRYAKVLRTGARLMLDIIRAALLRHEKVIVRMVRGNHDPESSLAIALILDAYFAQEPRVTVDLSPSAFWYYQFGKVLLGSTHGDTCKLNDLGAIMAADRPREWGESHTSSRVWFTGHRHNHRVMELTGGVIVEVARTLAPKDSWTAESGYRSGRDLQSVVFHKEHGEVERHTCSIDRARRRA